MLTYLGDGIAAANRHVRFSPSHYGRNTLSIGGIIVETTTTRSLRNSDSRIKVS
jgi:hypothetical protein